VKKPNRFTKLKVAAKDLAELRRMRAGGRMHSARTWRRMMTLEHLAGGKSLRATAKAVGGYPREVTRVARRYMSGGLSLALSDDRQPGPGPMLDSAAQAAVVALVCGPPPTGNARWTIRLITSEVQRRGIIPRVGRETIRITLATHELKPWREKNVGACRR
jgi:Homeodomain-like domain